MRADFLSRQRAWEAAQAKNAPSEEEVYLEEEEGNEQLPEDMEFSNSQAQPEDEVEHFLRDEDQELEALLEFMPADAEDGMKDDGESLWSDDADYDELFEHMLSQQEQQQPQCQSLGAQSTGSGGMEDGGEEMDMS